MKKRSVMQNYIEKMAREYREVMATEGDNTATVERIVALEENQSEYLAALALRVPSSARRNVNYLKNLVFRILQKLNALLKNDAYVPAFRNNNMPCQALVGSILGTQTNIFVLYDKLDLPYADLAEILALENRKAALLALL